MLSTVVLLLLATSPALISSLQCNVCRERVRLNYTMTTANVPTLPSDCSLIDASLCWVSIFWELDFNRTELEFHARPGPPSPNATVRDMVSVRIGKAMSPDNQTLYAGVREVNYECASGNGCNGQVGIQKIIGSLTIEDQFQQQIAPLLKLITPFQPREADCAYIHNTTFRCPAPSFRNCHRCTIEAGRSVAPNEYVCATCDETPVRDNFVERFSNFIISNRTEDFEVSSLGCQLKGCNSIENADLVYKASTIKFNSEAYFKN